MSASERPAARPNHQSSLTPSRDVFICYSSDDNDVANAVCAALEAAQLRCWIAPRNIPPGAKYGSAIFNAIAASRVVVLILSEQSNQSVHVLKEIDLAVKKKDICIIPFQIEDVYLSSDLEYFLSTLQRFDARTPSLDRHAQRLAGYLQRLLEQPGPIVRPPPPPEPPPPKPPPRIPWLPISLTLAVLPALVAAVVLRPWPRWQAAQTDRPPTTRQPPAQSPPRPGLPKDAAPPKVVETPPRAPASFAERFEAMKADYATRSDGMSAESRRELFQKDAISQKVQDLIRDDPDAPEVPDAVLWVVIHEGGDPPVYRGGHSRKFAKLRLDDFEVENLIQVASGPAVSWALERLLREMSHHPGRSGDGPGEKLRGVAHFALARRITGGDAGRSAPQLPKLRRTEAKQLLDRAMRSSPDVPIADRPLEELAEDDLFALEGLSVGSIAPEISGQDIDDRTLRLSDLRGKVVVVSVHPKREQNRNYDSSHSEDFRLFLRFENEAFALLGIYGDHDDAMKIWDGGRTQHQAEVWRAWADASILARWDVLGRPIRYVIDREGVIRHRFAGPRSPDGLTLHDAITSVLNTPPAGPRAQPDPPKAVPAPNVTIQKPEADLAIP